MTAGGPIETAPSLRVDAHHHVWDLAARAQPWTAEFPVLQRSFSFDELRPSLQRHGLDLTVVVQTVAVPDEAPELLQLAGREPMVGAVVGWIDLTAPDVSIRLDTLCRGPGGEYLVGIRHPAPGAGRERSALAVPSIASGRLSPWAADIAELARCPNVVVKISGLVTEADPRSWTATDLRPYVDELLRSFGPNRLMFGSDWPVCLVSAPYDRVIGAAEELTVALTGDEQEALFVRTAAHWYGLPVGPPQ